MARFLGKRKWFFPLCPSTGKELEGLFLQDRWTTCCHCCNHAQVSHKFPSWFQRSPNTVINVSPVGKVLPRVHSALQAPRNQTAEKIKVMPPTEKGRKILSTIYIYIYTCIYIFLLIIRSSKVQISPEMQKYRLYRSEKPHACYQCHAISVTVREVTQCQIQLPCIGVPQWRCLRRDSIHNKQ